MIQSGLYAALVANAGIQALLPKDSSGASLAKNCVTFVRGDKLPGDRFIVVYVVNAPPAATSMDGTSGLTDGEFQFDCFADDDNDPNNAALAATELKDAVRGVFENFEGQLPDGSTVVFYERPFDMDGGYEAGGRGYLSRRILRLRAFYSESGAEPVSGALRFADSEVPSGIINGSNMVFSLANVPNPPDSLQLFRNGLLMWIGEDFMIDGKTITFTQAPGVGNSLEAFYRY